MILVFICRRPEQLHQQKQVQATKKKKKPAETIVVLYPSATFYFLIAINDTFVT